MVRHKDKTKDQSQSSHCPKTFERPSGSVETIVQDTLQERQAHWQQNVKKRAVAQGFCTALYSTEYNIITLNRKMLGPNQPAMDVKVWSQCTGRRRKLISTIKLQIYIFSQSCFYLTWTKSGMFSIPSCGDMIFFFFWNFFVRIKKKENEKDEDIKEEEREPKDRRCFQCGDMGHVRRDCPEYRHLKQRAAGAPGQHKKKLIFFPLKLCMKMNICQDGVSVLHNYF